MDGECRQCADVGPMQRAAVVAKPLRRERRGRSERRRREQGTRVGKENREESEVAPAGYNQGRRRPVRRLSCSCAQVAAIEGRGAGALSSPDMALTDVLVASTVVVMALRAVVRE